MEVSSPMKTTLIQMTATSYLQLSHNNNRVKWSPSFFRSKCHITPV